MDQMRKQYVKEKGYNVVEMWECEWWNLFKTTTCVNEHLRNSFPYKRSLREESLLEQIRSGKLFGYVQCDIELPEELKKKFAISPPIFKNTNDGRHDIGSVMKDYAMLRKRDFYVNHGKCWFQAISLKTDLSLHLCSYFI